MTHIHPSGATGLECPEWCDQHVTTPVYEGTLHSHRQSLWAHRLELIPGGWVSQLYVSSSTITGTEAHDRDDEIGMVMHHNSPDAIPHTISVEEARRLIAALEAGIALVLTELTANCAGCGSAVVPAEADQCGMCVIKARQAHRRLLTLVPDPSQASVDSSALLTDDLRKAREEHL